MSHDDARVHRCNECGTWRYGMRPCTTCAHQDRHEAAARHEEAA